MPKNGTFIGKDVEVVVTNKYIIIFRRNNDKDFLESCLLRKNDISGDYHCFGVCRSKPAMTEINSRPRSWEYAFIGQQKVYSNNKLISSCIGKSIVDITDCEKGIQLRFWDYDVYSAELDEAFEMKDIHPRPLDISSVNIGECLKNWTMGFVDNVVEINGDKFASITINTEKHMYFFEMIPTSFYCRAARYGTCNKGVAFNQNFRQRKSNTSETYMIEDNGIAGNALPINTGMFSLNACTVVNPYDLIEKHLSKREKDVMLNRYAPNGEKKLTQREIGRILGMSPSYVSRIEKKAMSTLYSLLPKTDDRSIYWSVFSYTENQIVLNGCQGDIYEWNKPDRLCR
jgi:hypothetical protein